MAITNYDGIISARAGGGADDRMFYKAAIATQLTGNWHCHIKGAGNPASAAYANASAGGAVMNSSSVGAIPLTAATTGGSKYLLTFAAGGIAGAEVGIVGLVDVLWAGAGIQMGSSATVTCNGAPSRSTSGVYNKIGVMTSTTLTTACTMTIWYTDQGDTATSIAVVIATGGGQGKMHPNLQLYPDTPNGVKSIQSCQVQGAQTAGAVDVMIFRPLDFIPTVTSYTWVERDMTAQIDGIMPLDTDSSATPGCLALVSMSAGATGRAITGMIRTVRG
jgi:hypothetical protein